MQGRPPSLRLMGSDRDLGTERLAHISPDTAANRLPVASRGLRRPPSEGSKEQHMPANLPGCCLTVALIALAPSAFATSITDWNEQAVAFLAKMAPAPAIWI